MVQKRLMKEILNYQSPSPVANPCYVFNTRCCFEFQILNLVQTLTLERFKSFGRDG